MYLRVALLKMRLILVSLCIIAIVTAESDEKHEKNKTVTTKNKRSFLFPQPLVLGPYQAPPTEDNFNLNSNAGNNQFDQVQTQGGFLPLQSYDTNAGNSYAGQYTSYNAESNNINGLHDDCGDDHSHEYHTLQGVYQSIQDTQQDQNQGYNYLAPQPQPLPQPQKVITKEVRIPVPQPYPVTVEKRVPVPVPQPYPVQVIKNVPYRVEVKIPVPVPRPYPVQVTKKVPVRVPVYVRVPQPYRVEVPVPRPYTVEKRVPVEVKVPVYIRVPVPVNTGFTEQHQQHIQEHHNGVTSDCDHFVGQPQPAAVYGPPGYQSIN